MTWNNPQAAGAVSSAVGKGCLAGLGLTAGFFIISAVAYVIAGVFIDVQRLRLLVSVASGPIIGTGITLIVGARLLKKAYKAAELRPPESEQQ